MIKPTTIEQCMNALSEKLSSEEQHTIRAMPINQIGAMHHGLGQWIRNNWGLWSGGELLEHLKSLGFMHPDDMSSAILVEYWNWLNNQPSTVNEQIAYYQEWWARHESGGGQDG